MYLKRLDIQGFKSFANKTTLEFGTGVTCVIDTEGRLTSELPRWKQGVLHASVPLVPGGLTFYAAHGDVIPIAAGIAGLVLAVMLLLIRHTNA